MSGPLGIDPPDGASVARLRAEAGLHGIRWLAKSTLVGKILSTTYRRRRAPRRALHSALAALEHRTPATAGTGSRYAAVAVIMAGPDCLAQTVDTVESIQRNDGNDTKVVVVDDATHDCRAATLRGRFPDIDVIRKRWPGADGFRLHNAQQVGIRWALERYDFDTLLKLDTDSLIVGPGLVSRAHERFAADPTLGMLGSSGIGANGCPEEYTFERFLLAHERRWSRRVRRLLDRARASVEGPLCGAQGGVYLVRRAALDRAAQIGTFPWRQPMWSFFPEDLCMSLIVQSAGYTVGSFGAPGEPVACLVYQLPMPIDAIVEQGKLAIHSVRRGYDGEGESEIRAFFRARAQPSLASESDARS